MILIKKKERQNEAAAIKEIIFLTNTLSRIIVNAI